MGGSAVNTNFNSNERFIINTVREIGERFEFNIIQQRALTDVLYKCTKNIEVNILEEDQSDFIDYINLYLQTKKIEGLSESTLKNKFYILRELNNYLNKNIDKITIADLRMYILNKQNKCKPSTINSISMTIKSFFSFLQDEGYININPSKKLKLNKIPKRLRKSLNSIELEQIKLGCENNRDRAIIEFLFATGVRISELVNVNISDLNLNNNTLRVIGKGNKERIVMFSDITEFYIKKYLESREDNNSALFISSKKPYNRLGQRAIQKIIKRIKSREGIEVPVTPHILRHTFATKLIAAGSDILTVQSLLGHEDINTTMIYAEANNDKIKYDYRKSMSI